MFTVGSLIKDPQGNEWQVIQTWTYGECACFALLGLSTVVANQFGGAKFKRGDAIFIRPRFNNTQ